MSDLISRQDAIEAIRKSVSKSETEDSLCYNLGLGVAEEVVNSLPSAEPKTGKWIKVIDEETPNVVRWHYECDQCGAGRWEKGQQYCQNCGAMMLGEDGE